MQKKKGRQFQKNESIVTQHYMHNSMSSSSSSPSSAEAEGVTTTEVVASILQMSVYARLCANVQSWEFNYTTQKTTTTAKATHLTRT